MQSLVWCCFAALNQLYHVQALVTRTVVGSGAMELERPTALQRHTCEQQLPCIDLLQQHLEHCGIEESAFNMLYRMIEMTSAIGWEVHLVFQSKIPSGPSIANIRYYMDCILQGCSSLHNAMQEAAVMAKDAANTLPALNELPVDELETRLKQWRWKLKYVLIHFKYSMQLTLTYQQNTAQPNGK
jgi:hypothetical protein